MKGTATSSPREALESGPGVVPPSQEKSVKRLLSCLAVTALALLSPRLARADKIDLKLAEEMPRVVKYLQDHGYKNVGVLRFRAQKHSDKQAHFDVGAINGNLADRLENLLVLNDGLPRNPDQPAFG